MDDWHIGRLSHIAVLAWLGLIYFSLTALAVLVSATGTYPFYGQARGCSGPPADECLKANMIFFAPVIAGTIVGFWIGHPIRATFLAIMASFFGFYLGEFLTPQYINPHWIFRLRYFLLHWR
jgi:hypothetical protein